MLDIAAVFTISALHLGLAASFSIIAFSGIAAVALPGASVVVLVGISQAHQALWGPR